jgi:hypothetical protein
MITAKLEEVAQLLCEATQQLRDHEMSVRARAPPDDRDGPMAVVVPGQLPYPINLFDNGVSVKPSTITFSARFTSTSLSRSSRMPSPVGCEEHSTTRSMCSLDTFSTARSAASTAPSHHGSEQHPGRSAAPVAWKIFESGQQDAKGVLRMRCPQAAIPLLRTHAAARADTVTGRDQIPRGKVASREPRKPVAAAQLTAWAEKIPEDSQSTGICICVGIIVLLLIIVAVLLQHTSRLQQELAKQAPGLDVQAPPLDVCEDLIDRGALVIRRVAVASSISLSAMLFVMEATAKHMRLLVDCSSGSAFSPASDCAILLGQKVELGAAEGKQLQEFENDALGERIFRQHA